MTVAVRTPTRLRAATMPLAVTPQIAHLPDLPAIDWASIGTAAPILLDSPANALPEADTVVITWTSAEWAALHHVFCGSEKSAPYSSRRARHLTGWQQYTADLPTGGPTDWQFWGAYRLVEIAGRRVLLFKSNTHLDWPGRSQLEALTTLIITQVKPSLILSVGTAGGTTTTDHVGTVCVVDAAAMYKPKHPPASWQLDRSGWSAATDLLDKPGFSALLQPIPTTEADLETLRGQFNTHGHSNVTLAELNPDHLNDGDPIPAIRNHTPTGEALLTAATFVVGTTDDTYADYACIEMDDAVLAHVCGQHQVEFGAVRNLSDPAQNAALTPRQQAAWGSLIYSTYGLYTSYNGALTAAAILGGMH